jgi:hypothetical protein
MQILRVGLEDVDVRSRLETHLFSKPLLYPSISYFNQRAAVRFLLVLRKFARLRRRASGEYKNTRTPLIRRLEPTLFVEEMIAVLLICVTGRFGLLIAQ